jgi:hypothetical protein
MIVTGRSQLGTRRVLAIFALARLTGTGIETQILVKRRKRLEAGIENRHHLKTEQRRALAILALARLAGTRPSRLISSL